MVLLSVMFLLLGQLYFQHSFTITLQFALVGLLVATYTIRKHEKTLLYTTISVYCLCFLAPIFQSDFFNHPQIMVKGRLLIESIVFLFTFLVLQQHIKRNSVVSLRKMKSLHLSSEVLLTKTLPKAILPKIQIKPDGFAEQYPSTTILFADLHNFTPLCSKSSANDVVALLNTLFSTFDKLIEQFNVQKIKTNGDEYVVAAGILDDTNDHAKRCCLCALAMQREFSVFNRVHGLNLGLRIGIARGEVIAGIIGKSMYNIEVWGETVNLASRMETNARINDILISPGTYVIVKHDFECGCNPKSQIKGFSAMHTYRLIKPQ